MNYDLFKHPIIEEVPILRVPYMGSKNSIALQLLKKMLSIKPKAKYFVDLFGGGGSMSFAALQLGMNVIYNEKQTSLVEFIKYIVDRVKRGERGAYGLFPDEFYKFITRQEFIKLKDDPSIYGQFARICYSFANNQKDYLFNPDLERTKHLVHNIVIFKCEDSLKEFNDLSQSKIKFGYHLGWNERRLDFQRQIRDRRQLAELQQLERLQQLEQLEQLERLQQLEQLEQLELFNLDYQDVIISTPDEETIIYLDPPYRGTSKYLEEFDYSGLDDYFRSLPFKAFLSEYSAPFESVLEIEKAQLMDNTKEKRTYITEKLFINE